MDGIRLFGSAGSGLANLLLFGTVTALWPRPPDCLYDLCIGLERVVTVAVDTWKPLIDNPIIGAAKKKEPECPTPLGGDNASLVDAPLPGGFDARAYGDRILYACVLVGRSGEVLGAHILRGTRRVEVDRSIVRSIRSDWRFRPGYADRRRGWQRVRLNPAPASEALYLPL
jgi:hypothetical protein